jgi:hypothetical protein
LNQCAAPKIKLPCKIEKQTANCHNTLTAGGTDGSLTLPQRKGWGKEISPQCGNPSKQAQQKATSKAGQLVDYRDNPLNLRTACKLKLPHLTERGTDQAVVAERQKNKTLLTSQSPVETMT